MTDTATAPPVSFFAPRAVLVVADLSSDAPLRFSGHIDEIRLRWAGGTARRAQHRFFAIRAQASAQMLGFSPLMTSLAPGAIWPFGVLLSSVPQSVTAVASADPSTRTPWMTPRCRSVGSAEQATQGSASHLSHLLASMTDAACAHLAAPQAIVLAGRPPALPVVYVFQPELRETVQGKTVTVDSRNSQTGTGIAVTAYNWWRFVR